LSELCTPRDDSRAAAFVEAFRGLPPDVAARTARAAWRQLSVVERAAVALDWSFWSRSKQRPPAGAWRTWGFLTGRGFGKTVSVSKFINAEVAQGRAKLLCLCAQDEQSAVDLQVNGPSGLIATASPFFRPQWEASALQLVWPNGARAYVRTPEVPGKIRGLEYHLSWISELQSWPNATRVEAMDMVLVSTRLGYARVVWDATPKKRHPLLKDLLARHDAAPETHVIVRGTTHENAANLGEGYVSELERKFGGTARGREELLGEMLEDSEFSLVKQAWIDDTRRGAPARYTRRVVSIDPAVTNRKGSDTTGIVEVGLGPDGQAYVLTDRSGKYDVGKWADIALEIYTRHGCDLVIAETNKGGQLVTQNLRALAKERGLEVVVIGKDERPIARAGKVFVKEVYARGAKEDRAEPVATAYERKRVSHVIGADLVSLEDTLTTWEPAPNVDSPGDLDALVHAVVELLDLANATPDPAAGFVGIEAVAKQIVAPPRPTSLAHVFSAPFGGRGDRL
jgi:phage terminase large subunit-like protein